jgi:DNA-binding NarL/FixJ family response regulator
MLTSQSLKRIFIVEDQTILRDLVRRVVEGYPQVSVVGTSGDGQDAYQQCVALKPDIVILDIMLPYLNGVEVLRRLKSKFPAMRILVFSEACSRNVIKQSVESGVDGFVEKDVELEELERAIERVIAGESYFGPRVTEVMRKIMTSPDEDNSLKSLTSRERQVLQLIAEGNTSKEIAKILNISYKTADTHRANIMDKLEMHNVAELTRFAISSGLTDKLRAI